MQQTIESDDFSIRLRKVISLAWSVFMRKAGNDLLPINKEASVQLQYAYILQQILPLIRYKDDENAEIGNRNLIQCQHQGYISVPQAGFNSSPSI